jgi:hypothetical protein
VGLLDSVKKLVMPGAGAEDYGLISVPGSAELDLPAGKVRLTYKEAKRSRNDATDGINDIQFSAPADLEVSVAPVGGGPALEITGPGPFGMGNRTSTTFGQSLDEIGTAEVPQAGRYLVTAATATTIADAVLPQVLIGR